MAPKKTPIGDEVEERLSYFEEWLEKYSDEEERSKVVNERTAQEFIRDVFMQDASLRNLIGGMDDQPEAYKKLVEGRYLQELMLKNAGEKLGKAVVRLKEREEDLRKALRKSRPRTQKSAIKKVMSVDVARKYGYNRTVNKRGAIQYRDKRGRFVSDKKLLDITEKVVLASTKRRKELENLLQKDFKGRKK